jgi:hypothetical protein
MVKLTVVYTLPAGADHEEFLRWRTTEHQRDNMSMPGVIRSDFYVVKRGFPAAETPYRYMTEAYFPDMATFEKAFFDPDYQVELAESLKRIADPMFVISEEVLSQAAA